jgi:hypothetical protein
VAEGRGYVSNFGKIKIMSHWEYRCDHKGDTEFKPAGFVGTLFHPVCQICSMSVYRSGARTEDGRTFLETHTVITVEDIKQ